jgi:pimeloyl-ACP methyl ester carboxylesterase
MRLRIGKIVKVTTIFAVTLIVIGIGGLLGLRAYYQHVNAATLAIDTPNGIREGMYVTIGGIEQWVQIRGQDRDNPVLLYLHGGPGASMLMATLNWQPWEKYFTIVQWDQRGAGRSFRRNGAAEAETMTIDRMVADGIEVTEFLRSHLKKDKIVLVGHSWGSILGIHMIKAHPELFAAYVGTGQVVDMQNILGIAYSRMQALALAAHDDAALAVLKETGPPPYTEIGKFGALSRLADRLTAGSGDDIQPNLNIATPDFSLIDLYYDLSGLVFSQHVLIGDHLDGPAMAVDLPSLGLDFSVPIFFFQGTQDLQTPSDLAQQYFDEIKAPHKEFVSFQDDHHFVAVNRPGEFLTELVARVRPWASPN